MTRESFTDSEETTKNISRPRLHAVAPMAPLEGSELELLGKVMTGQVATDRKVDAMQLDVQALAREVGGLRKDLEQDRGALVGDASRHAAGRASNRIAVLLGTLFVVYEQAAPTLHEIWKVLHK